MLPRRRRPAPPQRSSGSSVLALAPEAPLRCYCCRQLASRSTPATGCRSRGAVVWVLARRTRCGAGSRSSRGRGGGCGTRCRGEAGGTSTPWQSRRPESRSPSRPNAPRGALLYPRLSREELEGRFLGPMAYPDPKGERNNRMPGKRRSCQVSGVRRRGTRVIWRRLGRLKPNLQQTQRNVRRNDTCYRRHPLRRQRAEAVATFGAWSVVQRGQSRR